MPDQHFTTSTLVLYCSRLLMAIIQACFLVMLHPSRYLPIHNARAHPWHNGPSYQVLDICYALCWIRLGKVHQIPLKAQLPFLYQAAEMFHPHTPEHICIRHTVLQWYPEMHHKEVFNNHQGPKDSDFGLHKIQWVQSDHSFQLLPVFFAVPARRYRSNQFSSVHPLVKNHLQ